MNFIPKNHIMNTIAGKILLVSIFLCLTLALNSQNISTIAGIDTAGYSGDGGPATIAELYSPSGAVFDASGNLYIADDNNNRIREISTSGIISTFAGNGYNAPNDGGYSGDGGPATAAELFFPAGIAFDGSGNLYIADASNNMIRIVSTSGIINTIAGIFNPLGGYSGDGGPATAAELWNPSGVAVDASGNIYIADEVNNRVRKVNTSGIISTYAGNGYGSPNTGGFTGDGGPATDAELYIPEGVATDASGNVYIADYSNNRIRMVNTSGIINTIAGNGFGSPSSGGFSGDGGASTAAELYWPSGLSVDPEGNIFIADLANNRIRVINTSGIINTLAGDGYGGPFGGGFSGDGGPATAAELNAPFGVTVDNSGNVYMVDEINNRVRKVNIAAAGIDNILLLSDDVTIYPDPNTGSFTIRGISQGQTIEIYDYTGQKIYASTQPPPTGGGASFACQINISSLPDGIYLVRVLNKDGSFFATKKIVKTE
jgi:trimeric autotransporter adhesin